jgi:hypothetical protein
MLGKIRVNANIKGTVRPDWIYMRVVPYKNESNLLLVRITVCIEYCLPIGWHTFFDEKIRQSAALFWFGLRDIGILYSQAIIQITIDVSLPYFCNTVRQKMSRFEYMQTVIQTSRRLDSFLHEAAQNFELLSII